MPIFCVKVKDIDALADGSEDADHSFGGWTDLRGIVVVAAGEASIAVLRRVTILLWNLIAEQETGASRH